MNNFHIKSHIENMLENNKKIKLSTYFTSIITIIYIFIKKERFV